MNAAAASVLGAGITTEFPPHRAEETTAATKRLRCEMEVDDDTAKSAASTPKRTREGVGGMASAIEEVRHFCLEAYRIPCSAADASLHGDRFDVVLLGTDADDEMMAILNCVQRFPFFGAKESLLELLQEYKGGAFWGSFFDNFIGRGTWGVLSLEGIRTLIDDYNKTASGAKLVVALGNVSALPALWKELPVGMGKRAIVVKQDGDDAHVTPILIEETKDALHILLSDSTSISSDYNLPIIAALQTIGKTLKKPLILYGIPFARQADHTNCSMFALKDLKSFFTIADFFAVVRANTANQRTKLLCYDDAEVAPQVVQIIAVPPRQFLRLVQVLAAPKSKYLTAKTFRASVLSKMGTEGAVLQRRISQYTDATGMNQRANMLMTRALARLGQILIEEEGWE